MIMHRKNLIKLAPNNIAITNSIDPRKPMQYNRPSIYMGVPEMGCELLKFFVVDHFKLNLPNVVRNQFYGHHQCLHKFDKYCPEFV
jgi:hypothetical protein